MYQTRKSIQIQDVSFLVQWYTVNNGIYLTKFHCDTQLIKNIGKNQLETVVDKRS
jgi:hypothetical protein